MPRKNGRLLAMSPIALGFIIKIRSRSVSFKVNETFIGKPVVLSNILNSFNLGFLAYGFKKNNYSFVLLLKEIYQFK